MMDMNNQPGVDIMGIRDNFQRVKKRIEIAAKIAGRANENIQLVVVTKTHPCEVLQAVIEAGATDLGENYVEEAIPKIEALRKFTGICWHMIGHLQSRKALPVCEYFHTLHSLDSRKLAERLSRFSIERSRRLPVYLEFNVAGEESKSGWDISSDEKWPQLLPELEAITGFPGLDFLGLMTIPPYSIDPEASRQYYRKLRKFQEYLVSQLRLSGFQALSMGMSVDFEVAIQEGSTCVRIGQAILGPRTK